MRLDIVEGRLPESATFAGTPLYFERPLPVVGAVRAGRYWLRAGDGGVVGDSHHGARIFAPDAEWLETGTFLRTLFPLSLLFPLAERGLFYAHGAMVVDPDGQGWLLVGEGGAGKSTTAYGLVRRGWSYVADDAVLLRYRAGGVEALSFLDEFHLSPGLAPTFPELEFEPALRAHPRKGIVALDRLFPARHRPAARPDILVALVRGRARAQVERGALVQVFVNENPLIFVAASRPHLALLTRLVRSCQVLEARVDRALLDDPVAVLTGRLRRVTRLAGDGDRGEPARGCGLLRNGGGAINRERGSRTRALVPSGAVALGCGLRADGGAARRQTPSRAAG